MLRKWEKKYLDRYLKYFDRIRISVNLICSYEQLLLDADRWTEEVCRACGVC